METEENKTEMGDASTITKMVCRHTAKTQYRKLETNIPRTGITNLSPNFHIHVSVSAFYISTIGMPILLEEIYGPILRIYKSLTDT